MKNISTHAPLAGRDSAMCISSNDFYISTHAPLAGRDRPPNGSAFRPRVFQPTRPLRGATSALCAGYYRPLDFNPRAPCGARQAGAMWRRWTMAISTHAPLAGRDPSLPRFAGLRKDFNPRAPCGARRGVPSAAEALGDFNPRAPCGARPLVLDGALVEHRISTHAPLAGRDSKSVQITMHIFAITDKFQMFLRKMPTVRAFCFFFVREKRANFSANRPDNFCALVLRTIRSSVPRADTSACSRSVRFYSRTSCPSSKIEGCPFLGQ